METTKSVKESVDMVLVFSLIVSIRISQLEAAFLYLTWLIAPFIPEKKMIF